MTTATPRSTAPSFRAIRTGAIDPVTQRGFGQIELTGHVTYALAFVENQPHGPPP